MRKNLVEKPRKPRKRVLRTRYSTPINRLIYVSNPGEPIRIVADYVVSTKMTDWTVKPGSLEIVREVENPTIGWTANDGSYSFTEGSSELLLSPSITYRDCVAPLENRLRVKKLATSNQADLLTNLAEFDDTLLMMTKNIKKSASYGGYQWGWAPLISDIMATNDAASNVSKSLLSNGIRTNPYVTKDTFTVKSAKVPLNIGISAPVHFQHIWDVVIKYSGSISYDNDICAFYDYMGFHPSPKLFWDLVPLSFAVDYVLPIGDMLKQVTPSKGWVKSANFTGWRTITAKVREVSSLIPGLDYGKYNSVTYGGRLEFVNRNFLQGIALEQKTIRKTIEALKMPTWQQAFDLSYLSEAFYNKGRSILRPHVYRKR